MRRKVRRRDLRSFLRPASSPSAAPILIAGLLLADAAAPAFGEEPETLPRSIYVPLRLEVASCLHDVVVLAEDGRVRAVAPGRLVSQFTFYSWEEGAIPAWERLTIQGWIANGEAARRPFRAGIVITPASIYVADRRLDLGTLDQVSRFRSRTDLRIPERTLRLLPEGACDRGAPLEITAEGSVPESPVPPPELRPPDEGR